MHGSEISKLSPPPFLFPLLCNLAGCSWSSLDIKYRRRLARIYSSPLNSCAMCVGRNKKERTNTLFTIQWYAIIIIGWWWSVFLRVQEVWVVIPAQSLSTCGLGIGFSPLLVWFWPNYSLLGFDQDLCCTFCTVAASCLCCAGVFLSIRSGQREQKCQKSSCRLCKKHAWSFHQTITYTLYLRCATVKPADQNWVYRAVKTDF